MRCCSAGDVGARTRNASGRRYSARRGTRCTVSMCVRVAEQRSRRARISRRSSTAQRGRGVRLPDALGTCPAPGRWCDGVCLWPATRHREDCARRMLPPRLRTRTQAGPRSSHVFGRIGTRRAGNRSRGHRRAHWRAARAVRTDGRRNPSPPSSVRRNRRPRDAGASCVGSGGRRNRE